MVGLMCDEATYSLSTIGVDLLLDGKIWSFNLGVGLMIFFRHSEKQY